MNVGTCAWVIRVSQCLPAVQGETAKQDTCKAHSTFPEYKMEIYTSHFPVLNRVQCVLSPVWNMSPSSAQAVWEISDWTGRPSLWIRSRVQTGCRWSLCRASPPAALRRPAGITSAPLRWSALTSGDTTSAGDVKTPCRHDGVRRALNWTSSPPTISNTLTSVALSQELCWMPFIPPPLLFHM